MINSKSTIILPGTTGVYLFKKDREILYIGKSVNIKARVQSHVENAKLDPKEASIVKGADRVETIVTDSDFKAVLLESKLIRKYRPKYNVAWRDDKSYLYIKITVGDEFPKVHLSRQEADGLSAYFGPFSSVRATARILHEIRKIIPFCTQKKVAGPGCFYSKINLCQPCPNNIVRLNDIGEKQKQRKIYRNNIRRLTKLLNGDVDRVIGVLNGELKKCIRDKNYEEAILWRNKILRLEQLIFRHSFDYETMQYNQSEQAINDLKHILNQYFPRLDSLNRIECYDISNLNQKQATASMVVLTDGLIDRSDYRRFKIKNIKLHSDFEMLSEVLRRRFHNQWPKPDLIIIDGGKPQVKTIQKILADINFKIPLIGIAKRPDRIVIASDKYETVKPDYRDLGFNLIRMIRDESHRFARKYHLLLRDRDFLV